MEMFSGLRHSFRVWRATYYRSSSRLELTQDAVERELESSTRERAAADTCARGGGGSRGAGCAVIGFLMTDSGEEEEEEVHWAGSGPAAPAADGDRTNNNI